MITDSFDPNTEPIIVPDLSGDRIPVDACIITFSDKGLDTALKKYDTEIVGFMRYACGELPMVIVHHEGRSFAFYRSYIGAPAAAGGFCDAMEIIDTSALVVYGSCGVLDAAIPRNRLIVPTHAYRDEGTSYHYAAPSDYITVRGSGVVADFMRRYECLFVEGRTWSTDAFWRETRGNLAKRQAEGCVCVEMECSAMQAMCDWYGLDLYCFFYGADLLDAEQWDPRKQPEAESAAHKKSMFDLALTLAADVTRRS